MTPAPTTETKHTPGPWLRDAGSGVRCDVRAENGRKVALCWGLSTSKAAQENRQSYRDECDANARLIAAAPDLLDAIKVIVHNYDTGNYAAIDMPAARAAIAKAEGRQS